MNIKRYIATDMRRALTLIREELGMDAVILSSRQTRDGLEVVAAVDYDEHLVDSAFGVSKPGSSSQSTKDGIGGARFVDRLRRRRVGEEMSGSTESGSPVPRAQEHAQSIETTESLVTARQSVEPASDANASEFKQSPGESDAPAIQRPRTPVGVTPMSRDIGRSMRSLDGDEHMSREDSMQNEINALRRMLEGQLSRLAWHDFSRRSPLRAALLRDLMEMGLSAPLAQELASDVSDSGDLSRVWREALGKLACRIQVADRDPLQDGGVLAVVGPTGAGKTTTIAKLAARYADRHGPENIAVITADDYRVGAQEQLFIYGRTLNIPIYAAQTGEELHYRIAKLSHAKLVLVDTAGSGYRDQEFQRLSEIIKSAPGRLLPYVVLAANAELRSLRETVAAFSSLPLAGVAVTKLDEAARLGGLLSVLIESGLPVTWSSDGREVPENLRRASARNLVRLAAERMPGAERETIDEDVMAQQIGPMEFAFG